MNLTDLERGNELKHKIEFLEHIIESAKNFLEPHKEEQEEKRYKLSCAVRYYAYEPEVPLKTVKSIVLTDIKNKETELLKLQNEFKNLN